MNAHELAQTLKTDQIVFDKTRKNADGTARRYKITSVKTWIRDDRRIRVGLRHGCFNTFAINSLGAWESDITTVEPIYPKPDRKAKNIVKK
jgi:hypothetical protein